MISNIIKLLTFRLKREGFLNMDRKYLLTGIFFTWIVGMGRYWDDTEAHLMQHLGMGSVVYIFLLSLLIYLVVWPLKPKNWTYTNVLTFISLTSIPAILYALPVERWFSLEVAISMNTWFLIVVALWRVLLLFYFLKVFAQLGGWSVTIVALLPICFIIVLLTVLNLERAVFDIMGGYRDQTPDDGAYQVLVSLTMISVILFIPLLLSYVVLIQTRRLARKQNNE